MIYSCLKIKKIIIIFIQFIAITLLDLQGVL